MGYFKKFFEKKEYSFRDMCKQGVENYERGIREVVEWIEREDAIDRMMRERWQAKLKDWGLE